MRYHTALLLILAFGLAGLRAPAGAQEDPKPELSPADAEAYAITENFQFGCDPRRSAKASESESRIEHDPAPLVGRASVVIERSGEFFLVLDQYHDDGSFCVVLTRRGGVPAPGRYAVGRVSAQVIAQRESRSEAEPFYGTFARRTATEASFLVVDSGFVDITVNEGGTVAGAFELIGFAIDGATRTDGVVRRGTFTAVHVER